MVGNGARNRAVKILHCKSSNSSGLRGQLDHESASFELAKL